MDVRAGMAALQAVHRQADAGAIDRPALHRQSDAGGTAAGTGHGEHALGFGVQIDECPALELGQIDCRGTQQADLLLRGHDHFQRRVGNGIVRQQSQRHSGGNAVIAAQSGAPGVNAGAVVGHVQALRRHINGAGGLLLADHIDMALQNHRGMILHAAGARGKEDNIVHFVLNIAKVMRLRKSNQIVGELLCVPGAVGNGADFFEIAKHCRRHQARQLFCFHVGRSFTLL